MVEGQQPALVVGVEDFDLKGFYWGCGSSERCRGGRRGLAEESFLDSGEQRGELVTALPGEVQCSKYSQCGETSGEAEKRGANQAAIQARRGFLRGAFGERSRGDSCRAQRLAGMRRRGDARVKGQFM